MSVIYTKNNNLIMVDGWLYSYCPTCPGCKCFDGDIWSSQTTYSTGDNVIVWDETYKYFKVYWSKQDNNTDHEPPNATWWEYITWKQSTPKHFTVTFNGISNCCGVGSQFYPECRIEGYTFILSRISNCVWETQIDFENGPVQVRLNLANGTLYVNAWDFGLNGCAEYGFETRNDDSFKCKTSATVANQIGQGDCYDCSTECHEQYWMGYGGTAYYRPGNVYDKFKITLSGMENCGCISGTGDSEKADPFDLSFLNREFTLDYDYTKGGCHLLEEQWTKTLTYDNPFGRVKYYENCEDCNCSSKEGESIEKIFIWLEHRLGPGYAGMDKWMFYVGVGDFYLGVDYIFYAAYDTATGSITGLSNEYSCASPGWDWFADFISGGQVNIERLS